MNADALGLTSGGELSPALSAITNRGRGVSPFAPTVRMSTLLSAAARVGASRLGTIESSPAMPKATAQHGTRHDRTGGKLTQAQIDARALQRTEDDDLIRSMTSELLAALGHVVYEAADAQSALALIQIQAVNLLITDVGLPGMSGEECLLGESGLDFIDRDDDCRGRDRSCSA